MQSNGRPILSPPGNGSVIFFCNFLLFPGLWEWPCLGWWLGEAGHPDTIICIAYQQKQYILLIIQKTQKNISLFHIHTFRTPLVQVNFILAVLTDLV